MPSTCCPWPTRTAGDRAIAMWHCRAKTGGNVALLWQLFVAGDPDGLVPAPHVQLAQDRRHVAPHRARGDEEVVGHLGRGPSGLHHPEHLPLALGQLREWPVRTSTAAVAGAELLHE